MTIAGLLFAFVTLLLAGAGVALLAQRGRARINFLETWALSWFFGSGVVSFLLWSGGAFLSGIGLQTSVTVVAVTLGVFGFALARKSGARVFFPKPHGATEWLLVAVIGLELGLMYYAALGTNLGWDGLLNWEAKARYAFQNHGILPAAYFQDEARVFTHPGYPLWVPFTELWLYLGMGAANQFWLKFLFPGFYAMGVVLLVVLASRLTERRWAGLLVGALIFFVPCLINVSGGAQEGYVDLPLGLLYLGGVGYLLLAGTSGETASWRLSALFLALLPWAKREGAILWLVVVIGGVVLVWRRRRSWQYQLWLLPGAGILLAWKIFLHRMKLTASDDFVPVTLATLQTNLPRAGTIARLLGEELIATSRWSIFWVLVALGFGVLLLRARDRQLLILASAIFAPMAAYAGAYFFSGWGDWVEHIHSSLTRLLLQLMPVAWLVIALAVSPPRDRPAEDVG
ncbi:MAG: hypothetical protein ABI992_07830 [Chthoniobacterales bacterium]